MQDDLIIIGSIILSLIMGICAAIYVKNIFNKIGVIGSSLVICLGLAYFGYRPFFGGTGYTPGTYFGCLTMIVGILAMINFLALESSNKQS